MTHLQFSLLSYIGIIIRIVIIISSSVYSKLPRSLHQCIYNAVLLLKLSLLLLLFKAGDTILLTSKVGNDWLVGYLEGNVMLQGLFPVRFVDIIVNVKDENPKEKVKKLTNVLFPAFLPSFLARFALCFASLLLSNSFLLSLHWLKRYKNPFHLIPLR